MAQTVLFFDSGVGGLSVLAEVRQQCPQLNLRYLMDDAEFPYGIKEDEVLSQRVLQVCRAAVNSLSPDLLVIACNTASTLALPLLRLQLTIPVVGVVPAIKPAAELANGGHIGLLATPATVDRLYIRDLIQDFAEHCQVNRLGSRQLVEWAEQHLNTAVEHELLKQHLQPWFDAYPEMMHVVLGCTHFPLLKPQLKTLWPHIHWIDSGEAIARRIESLLKHSLKKTQCRYQDKGWLALHWTSHQSAPERATHFLQQLGDVQHLHNLIAE